MKYSVESLQPKLDQFLHPLIAHAGFDLTYQLITPVNKHPEVENPEVTVNFSGNDVEMLLLNRAELLLALEHISMEAIRLPAEDHSLLSFDANDYRLMRVEELRMSAMAAAEKVKRSRIPFHFNPMTSRERRIIHLALRDEKELRSESLGVGPARAVVVVPADMPTPPLLPRRLAPSIAAPVPVQAEAASATVHATVVRPEATVPAALVAAPDRPKPLQAGDTIVAISTPPGRGGIGIVRLSGPGSRSIAQTFLRDCDFVWRPWSSQTAHLHDPQGAIVDSVILSFFPAGRSYTLEDVVEIACHGAPVVLRLCLAQTVAAGARLAEPGEFTLRAYLNGRLDLPQAEAVRDLIDATTLYQARVAAQQMEGSVSRRIKPFKAQLVELISLLEAGIDFAEDDISVATLEEITRRLDLIEHPLRTMLATFASGKLVFQGFTLAIAGRPNVGKSSLFNRLLQQDRAIVTDIPGTTRDTVSEATSLEGIPVRLVDTAGIRQSRDHVESLGIERSYQAMADADLTLLVLDASSSVTADDRILLDQLADRRAIIVGNKADLPQQITSLEGLHPVSAITGQGIPDLKKAVIERLAPGGLAAPESGGITSLRHEALLRESLEALENARRALAFGMPHEMLLLDLYATLRPMDAMTGATTADDILNKIFSTFCIGK